MTMLRNRKTVALLAVTVTACILLVLMVEPASFVDALRRVSPVSVMWAAAALAVSIAASCVRYHRVLEVLRVPVSFRLAVRANLLGGLGGVLFFQLVGQTFARTAVLRSAGFSGGAVLLANIYERLTAAASLMLLAVLGGLYLFGSISVNLVAGGANTLKLAIALLAVLFSVSLAVGRRPLRLLAKSIARANLAQGFARVGISSALVQCFTLLAFVILGHNAAPEVPLDKLTAASLIVMFAASVPISFGGWGVRELSAVYTLGSIGVDAEKALAVSVCVGLISLVLILVTGLAALWTPAAPQRPGTASALSHEPPLGVSGRASEIDRALSTVIPVLCASLLFFQVYVPVNNGVVNLNLADPVAVCGGILFLIKYISRSSRSDLWRVPHFEASLALTTFAIAFALLNGMAHFGFTEWAFYNRFVGWFVLLSYFGTGALAVWESPSQGLVRLLRCLLAAGLAVAAVDLLLVICQTLGVNTRGWLPLYGIYGMSQNANAFAIQLTVLLGAAICLQGQTRQGFVSHSLAFAVLMAALLYSYSRAGLVAAAVVVIFAMVLRWANARVLLAVALPALLLLVAPKLAAPVLSTPVEQSLPTKQKQLRLPYKGNNGGSDADRWQTLSDGYAMWKANPILGAGLGAFVKDKPANRGTLLMIHNSSLWLLAEFGVVGFTIFLVAFGSIAWAAWRPAMEGELWARSALFALLSFGIFQLVHDVFFQRIFWVILGASIFKPPLRRTVERARSSLSTAGVLPAGPDPAFAR